MRTLITIVLSLCSFIGLSQESIVSVEYFIDNDPGVGNGISVSIEEGNDLDLQVTVPIEDLDPGMHSIHFRTKNENDEWGLYSERKFFVRAVVEPEITASEYVLETDPGCGNGEPMVVANGIEIQEEEVIETGDLTPGIYMLKVRHQNASGNWGLYSRQPFFATGLIPPHSITQAEAFFDIDPGVGMGDPVTISNVEDVDETLQVPVPVELAEGDHIVYIRVKHNGEAWSLYSKHEFVVDNTVGIDEESLSFEMYPNPVKDQLLVDLKGHQQANFIIIDNQGAVVRSSQTSGRIDFSDVARGTYLVQLSIGEEAVSKRIVKM